MWAVKVLAKLMIRLCGIPYGIITKIGIMRHGRMDSLKYAQHIFDKAMAHSDPHARTILELGPGDSVASAYLAWRRDMRAILVDSGDYATKDAGLYSQLLGRPIESREEFLRVTGGQYLAQGSASLATLPAASVDFVFSNAVLEHIRAKEVERLLNELARVMKPGASFFHEVDFRDHLSGGLNNLRFPERFWEHDWVASAGFYTNRIPFSAWMALFAQRFETSAMNTSPFTVDIGVGGSVLKKRGWSVDDAKIAVARFVGRKPDSTD